MFFYCHGNISTDTGRELMIPYEILNGKILYKDILNIYAPLAYYINAFIYKLFGIKAESLYIGGAISSLIYLFVLNKISEYFLSKKVSFFITLFVALSCIYNSRLFNFILPYSYSMTYGLTFYICATYFIIKSIKTENQKFLSIASLLAGGAFACKIEFFTAILITLFVTAFVLRAEWKAFFKQIGFFLFFPVCSYLIPIIQGINLSEILYALDIFIKSSKVPSVIAFARQTGTAFQISDISVWLSSLVLLSIFTGLSIIFLKKSKSKLQTVLFLIIASLIHYISLPDTHFSWLAAAIIIFIILQYKQLREKPEYFVLIVSAAGASLRTIFIVNTNEYGAYSFPLLFVAFLAILYLYRENISKKLNINTEKLLVFVLLAGIISNFVYSIMQIKMYSTPIITERGRIDTTFSWANGAKNIIKFLKENTSEKDKVLFLPEGCLLNFLSSRNTEMNLYALNQPYIETYGESKIIKMIEKANINFIVIIDGFGLYNFNNERYYFKQNQITDYIKLNYEIIYTDKSDSYEVLILSKK
ncbi:MAG: glycosyltransferase family 39 protein [Candidatus Gastranaerophilaceae bacterium]